MLCCLTKQAGRVESTRGMAALTQKTRPCWLRSLTPKRDDPRGSLRPSVGGVTQTQQSAQAACALHLRCLNGQAVVWQPAAQGYPETKLNSSGKKIIPPQAPGGSVSSRKPRTHGLLRTERHYKRITACHCSCIVYKFWDSMGKQSPC